MPEALGALRSLQLRRSTIEPLLREVGAGRLPRAELASATGLIVKLRAHRGSLEYMLCEVLDAEPGAVTVQGDPDLMPEKGTLKKDGIGMLVLQPATISDRELDSLEMMQALEAMRRSCLTPLSLAAAARHAAARSLLADRAATVAPASAAAAPAYRSMAAAPPARADAAPKYRSLGAGDDRRGRRERSPPRGRPRDERRS